MTKSITDLARQFADLTTDARGRETFSFDNHGLGLLHAAIIEELTGEMPEAVAQLHPAHWKPNPDKSEWCREALLYSPNNEGDKLRGVNQRVKLVTLDQMREYAAGLVAKAVAAEREACAELMEEQDTQAPKHNAKAIRNRSNV